MKNPRALWQISVRTSIEAEDAVVAWLEGVLGQPATTYTDVETKVTTVTVCLAGKSDWPPDSCKEYWILNPGWKQA